MCGCVDAILRSAFKKNQAASLNPTTQPLKSVSHPKAEPALVQEQQSQQQQQQLLQACLTQNHGRSIGTSPRIVSLARCTNNPGAWRATGISGGQPAGHKKVINQTIKQVDSIPTENPQYFLWKQEVCSKKLVGGIVITRVVRSELLLLTSLLFSTILSPTSKLTAA